MSEIVGCCLLNLRCLPVGVFWSVCFRLWFRWSYNSTGYFCRVKWRQDLKGWHLPTANMLQHLEFWVTFFGWEDPFIFDDNFWSSLALAMNLTGFLNHAAGVHKITNLNQKICQIEDPYALAGRFVLLGAIRSFWRMTFRTVFFQKFLLRKMMTQHWYGCFLKGWYPQNTPKWGKPMVVGYHHFRKPPFGGFFLNKHQFCAWSCQFISSYSHRQNYRK